MKIIDALNITGRGTALICLNDEYKCKVGDSIKIDDNVFKVSGIEYWKYGKYMGIIIPRQDKPEKFINKKICYI